MTGVERRVGLTVGVFLLLSSAARAQAVYEACTCTPLIYYHASAHWFLDWDYYPVVGAAAPSPELRPPVVRKPRVMPLAEDQQAFPAKELPSIRTVPVKPAEPPQPRAAEKVIEKTPAPTTPAPTAPPPPEKRAPTVTESRLPGPLAPRAALEARCQVGFWNLSAKDVTLTVEGRARALPKDRALTLELPYRFVWQVDQKAAQTEQIPAGQTTHEVVIRE